MNILLFNQKWFQEELTRAGHRVLTAGAYPESFDIVVREPVSELSKVLAALPPDFVPDRLVYYDNSSLPWLTGFVHSRIPSLYYSVDTHQHPGWHPPYSAVFDACLVAQKDYLENFSAFQSSVQWFPPWANAVFGDPEAKRSRAAVFRGTLSPTLNPQRIAFLESVSRLAPLEFGTGEFEGLFADAKIVLNHAVKGDLNFRVFEALASGALLVTPEVGNGLFELFEEGKDLVTYRPGDPADAAEKINYYLAHEEERVRIARSGRDKIAAKHIAAVRATELAKILETLEPNPNRKKYVGAAYGCLTSASVWGGKGRWPAALLNNSAEALLRSIASEEWDLVETIACVVLCREFMERSGEARAALAFLRKLYASAPHNTALTLVLLDSLLAADEHEEAGKIAARLGPNPAQLLLDLPAMVERLRREALLWFYGPEAF